TVGDDTFFIRSVVFVDKSLVDKTLILGNSTGIVIPHDYNVGRMENTYLIYDPLGAGIQFKHGDTYVRNPPIFSVSGMASLNSNDNSESFVERASTRCTIFIYVKPKASFNIVC